MANQWYYSKNNQRQGPISAEQLKQLATSGQLQPSDLVWKEGMGQWVEGRKIKGLFPAPVTPSPQSPPNIPQAGAVPQQWYYVKNGQRQGPASTDQIKQLLASGQLQPSDLAWKEGMSQWVAAGTITELSQAQAKSSPQLPPSVPAVPSSPSAPGTTAAPALWNPQAAGLWSVLFTWAFGAFLLAKNWKALGNEARVKRCMFWFYGYFPLIPAFAVLYYLMKRAAATADLAEHSSYAVLSQATWSSTQWFLGFLAALLIPMFVWAFLEVNPQAKFVKEHFGNQYPRRGWLAPLGIAAGLIYLVPIFVGALIGGVIAGFNQEQQVVINNGERPYVLPLTDGGTITFAEHVDPKTFQAAHEGTTFSTGWVAMVVRGTAAFGDSKLVFSQRKHGEAGWSILSEDAVSPQWNIMAKPVLLSEPGDYEIRAATSQGKTVAEGLVHITTK